MAHKFKAITEYNFNAYSDTPHSRTVLEAEYRKLAKRANQRLVRLERAKSNITGETYSSFGAYQVYAVPALDGKRRFKESGVNMMYADLQKKITELQQFLSAKTSTVQGQRDAENKRIDTFASGKWGAASRIDGVQNRKIASASNKDFYDFLGSNRFKELRRAGYGSDELVELYDEVSEKYGSEDAAEKIADAYDHWAADQEANISDLRSFLSLAPMI